MYVLKTAPTIEPISVEEAKEHMRIDHTEEDTYVGLLIKSAREMTENYLRRSLITQTWECWMDAWPPDPFTVLHGNLLTVTSIKYYDTDDVIATFASTYYYADTKSDRIGLNYGESWPTTTLRPINGVVVEFTAGYGATAASVPEAIRQAMLLLVGHLYENREPVVMGTIIGKVPFAYEAMLYPYRNIRF